MALDSFANLKAAIATHAWRTGDAEFEASVPDFIVLLESLLNHGTDSQDPLRVRDMVTTAPVALTNGSGSLPADYLQWKTVKTAGATSRPLSPMPETYGTSEFPNASGGYADHFYITGITITTVPASDADLSLTYYRKIPALSDSSTTNWLLSKAPNVYLYGSLMFAAVWMMDDQRAGTFSSSFQQAIGGLKRSDRKSVYARPVSRTRGPTP